MAHLLPSTFLSLLLFFPLSSASSSHRRHDEDLVHEVCKASRDPSTCKSSLSKFNHMPPNASLTRVIDAAMRVSSENLDKSRFMVHDIILNASSGIQNRTKAAKSCKQVLYYAYFRTNKARDALSQGKIKDARAWMSAALVYQYDCWSGLKKVNDTPLVVETMEFLNTSLMASTSNALGMLVNFDIFGENTKSWHPPKTERDGVWEIGSDRDDKVGGFPSGLKANVSVCKSEDACDYKTVQRAVNAAPTKNIRGLGKWFVIHIKAGVYEETVRVPMGKKNVVFLGDGMGKTIITGSRNVGLQGLSTFKTATLGVLGDGFMASGLTIQNTAGPGAHQAVAFRSDSDLSILENCEFIGNQDTVYAHSLRQYYKSCRIHGNIDFIFGNSASFFHDCHILITPRQVDPEKGEDNAVTAHARTDPAQSTGFVFQNCVINGTDEYMNLYHRKPKVHNNFLGRPWKEYSRTVFIGCTLEALISPDGWMAWDGEFALKTLYYGEFHNTGPGSDTSKRVNWSSCIPEDRVRSYSVQNFIQGDHWISI